MEGYIVRGSTFVNINLIVDLGRIQMRSNHIWKEELDLAVGRRAVLKQQSPVC